MSARLQLLGNSLTERVAGRRRRPGLACYARRDDHPPQPRYGGRAPSLLAIVIQLPRLDLSIYAMFIKCA